MTPRTPVIADPTFLPAFTWTGASVRLSRLFAPHRACRVRHSRAYNVPAWRIRVIYARRRQAVGGQSVRTAPDGRCECRWACRRYPRRDPVGGTRQTIGNRTTNTTAPPSKMSNTCGRYGVPRSTLAIVVMMDSHIPAAITMYTACGFRGDGLREGGLRGRLIVLTFRFRGRLPPGDALAGHATRPRVQDGRWAHHHIITMALNMRGRWRWRGRTRNHPKQRATTPGRDVKRCWILSAAHQQTRRAPRTCRPSRGCSGRAAARRACG